MSKILLIGCGYWGKNWYKTIMDSKYDLVGVVDSTPIISVDVNLYNDISDVDVPYTHVIIAIPSKYVSTVIDQVNVSYEKVLIEKPCGTSLNDAYNVKDTHPGFVFLHSPQYKVIKERLNLIGKPLLYYSNRSSMGPRIRTDVSILEDYLIHDLYIYIGLFGPTVKVKYINFLNNFEYPIKSDTISLGLEANNVSGNMFSSWRFPEKNRKVVIVGTKGSFIWDNDELKLDKSNYTKISGNDSFGNVNNKLNIEDIQSFEFSGKSNLELELDSFIKNDKLSVNLLDVWKVIEEIKNEKSTVR